MKNDSILDCTILNIDLYSYPYYSQSLEKFLGILFWEKHMNGNLVFGLLIEVYFTIVLILLF